MKIGNALLIGAVWVACAVTPIVRAQSPGKFTATGNMITPRMLHTATLLLDGRVLIAGGIAGVEFSGPLTNTAEIYDPVTETFAATGNMAHARYGHSATRLPDGRVLITGGDIGNDAEIYDSSTGTFTSAGSMTAGRRWHSATLLDNGKVLIAGGAPSDGSAPYIAGAELYDTLTGMFTATGSMTTPRYEQKATLLANGKVLVAPGSDGADYTSAELYDPDSGTFSPLAFTNSGGLVAATASLLTNGTVLFTLDVAECDFSSRSASSYDPSTGMFAAAPGMAYPHCQEASARLTDGSVLIVGSLLDSVGPLPGAEIYNPASGGFSPTGAMSTGRDYPRATLLNSGLVLVSGGSGVSTELYNPPSSTPPPVLLSVSGGAPGQGAVLHADTHLIVSPANPAIAGEALEIYCTGLIDGSVVPPQVAIGGRMAQLLYFGHAPGYAGLNQVNVRVPGGLTPGLALSVRLSYLDRVSNAVTLSVQ